MADTASLVELKSDSAERREAALPVRLRSAPHAQSCPPSFGETAFARRMACLAVAHLRKATSRKASEGWRKRLGVEPDFSTDSKGLAAFLNSADPRKPVLCRGEPPNCPQRRKPLTAFLRAIDAGRRRTRAHPPSPRKGGRAHQGAEGRRRRARAQLRDPLRPHEEAGHPGPPTSRRRPGVSISAWDHAPPPVRHVSLPACISILESATEIALLSLSCQPLSL
jgi:hypothetical protein